MHGIAGRIRFVRVLEGGDGINSGASARSMGGIYFVGVVVDGGPESVLSCCVWANSSCC